MNCDTVASAPKDNLEVRVYMDGRLTNRIGHRPRSGGSSSSTIEGVIDGPGLIRPFEFAPLVLTGEQRLCFFTYQHLYPLISSRRRSSGVIQGYG